MKKIIVAFDFSKNAEHALEYAVFFANKFKAGVSLLWIDDSVSKESLFDPIEHDLRVEMKASLDEIKEKTAAKLENGKIDIILSKGKVYQEIHKIASRMKADFVFTGTHGVSGYEQYWIGSNANRIVTSSPCPVITIKSGYDFSNGVKRLAIPLDSSPETKLKLPTAIEVAQCLKLEIHLIGVYNSKINVIRKRIAKSVDDAAKYISEKGLEAKIDSIESDNIIASLLNYVDENNIDLISMMTDQGSTTANRYLGAYAGQLINNSTVPIISSRAETL